MFIPAEFELEQYEKEDPEGRESYRFSKKIIDDRAHRLFTIDVRFLIFPETGRTLVETHADFRIRSGFPQSFRVSRAYTDMEEKVGVSSIEKFYRRVYLSMMCAPVAE